MHHSVDLQLSHMSTASSQNRFNHLSVAAYNISSSPTTSNWKYVDDITISEVVPLNGNSVLKLELDDINSWTLANDMNLNPGKCKEIVVCFSRLEGLPPALIIDGESIRESSGLKWNMHVNVKHNHAAGKTRGCIM